MRAMVALSGAPPKAQDTDFLGRFREVIADPFNLLIERVPYAGVIEGDCVFLHNGNKVPVRGPEAYYGGFSDILVVNRGVHEPVEEYVFQETLKLLPDAPRMIELGAYWAHYSMWLKKVKPGADVIMVEPAGPHLEIGRRNFARNGLVGEFIHDVVAPHRWQVNRFFYERSIGHLDILHADIQAAEMEMLRGADDMLDRRRIDYLFVSTHSQELHAGAIAFLRQYDYRIEVSSDFENETTSFDGLVVASSPSAKRIFREFSKLGRTEMALAAPKQILDSLVAFQVRNFPFDPTSL